MDRAKWLRIAAAVGVLAACGERPVSEVIQPTPEGVRLGELHVAVSSRHDVPAAYVSLPPGSAGVRGRAIVTNLRTGATASIAVTDGGFDPVPVGALATDQLRIELQVDGASNVTTTSIARNPPVVVRTVPARRRTSVPLNTRMQIVFSQPIDMRTVHAGTIRLVGPAGPEDIDRMLDAAGTTLEIVPFASLRAGAQYQLIVGEQISDLDGLTLGASQTIDFETAGAPPNPTDQAVALEPDTLVMPLGTYASLGLWVDHGARRIPTPDDPRAKVPDLAWSSSDPSVVANEERLLQAVKLGTAWVRVTYKGDVDSTFVIVTTFPPPRPTFQIYPRTPIGVTPNVTLQRYVTGPANVPMPPVTWRVTNPAVASVDQTGLVKSLAPGAAWLVAATTTGEADSVQITVVGDPPKLPDGTASQHRLTLDSLLLEPGQQNRLVLMGPNHLPVDVTWTSADSNTVRVERTNTGNWATGLKTGRTTLSVRFADQTVFSVVARVTAPQTLGTMTLTPATATLRVGEILTLEPQLDPVALALWGDSGLYVEMQSTVFAAEIVRPDLRTQPLPRGVTIRGLEPGVVTLQAWVGPLSQTRTLTVIP